MARYLIFAVLLIGILASPFSAYAKSSQCVAPNRDLERGAKDAGTGGQVSVLQKFLVDHNKAKKVKVSGRYDAATVTGVKSFQKKHDIVTNGFSGKRSKDGEVVGPITRAVMKNVCDKVNKKKKR